MRLFISYARVDKYYCNQIIELLDVHEVWYDHRLHAGQEWWEEIRKHITMCDGLVYLISPDSVNSEYCRREFELAQSLGKHVFPVLIQARTQIPESLAHIHYADLSAGLTPEAVKNLLNSIYIAERSSTKEIPVLATPVLAAPDEPSAENVDLLFAQAIDALDDGKYDRAAFLLKKIRDSGYEMHYVDIASLIEQADDALEQEAYRRQAEREYAPIAVLIKRERTRSLGLEAFRQFRKFFPDYDPDNLKAFCATQSEQKIEWRLIPPGEVTLASSDETATYVAGFHIGRYPVTLEQYAEFIHDPNGYLDTSWWSYTQDAFNWRMTHPDPIVYIPEADEKDFPVVKVCWYEAVAYCQWLSHKTGKKITLPTEAQWQRAAQGDDNRLYPWGDEYKENHCNSKENNLRHLTPVHRYPNGVSPYGVYDMAGNVWEWCLTTEDGQSDLEADPNLKRVVKGGSFISPHKRAQCDFQFLLDAQCRYDSIGFRLVMEL